MKTHQLHKSLPPTPNIHEISTENSTLDLSHSSPSVKNALKPFDFNEDPSSTSKFRLIRRKNIDPFEMNEDFDEKEWYKRAYGPDIVVVK